VDWWNFSHFSGQRLIVLLTEWGRTFLFKVVVCCMNVWMDNFIFICLFCEINFFIVVDWSQKSCWQAKMLLMSGFKQVYDMLGHLLWPHHNCSIAYRSFGGYIRNNSFLLKLPVHLWSSYSIHFLTLRFNTILQNWSKNYFLSNEKVYHDFSSQILDNVSFSRYRRWQFLFFRWSNPHYAAYWRRFVMLSNDPDHLLLLSSTDMIWTRWMCI
jgi:hypothetical protein